MAQTQQLWRISPGYFQKIEESDLILTLVKSQVRENEAICIFTWRFVGIGSEF